GDPGITFSRFCYKNENNDPAHCLKEEFEAHWQCLDRNNQELRHCRGLERKFNSCVFNALNLEKVIPGSPPNKPPIHLKERPLYKERP
ncbi:16315_t:CDS:2, partial [Racocetra fulgida]